MQTAEQLRLAQATGRAEDDLFDANPWYEWGPYLSERAWGTVREDYSDSGDAWSFFPHDHARSRAYRWNEDGMAGLSDIHHDLCLGLALWNGVDPILKERMFGLTGPQGNHGEDVKDYWWYLDALPSHAWLRWRYHYPQTAFPYQRLVEENARRSRDEPEFELLDTGVFDENRYWSVDVTYAKASPTEVLARITIENHGPTRRHCRCCRPCGSATPGGSPGRRRRRCSWTATASPWNTRDWPGTGWTRPRPPMASEPLAVFCDNETNTARLFGSPPVTRVPEGRDQRSRRLRRADGEPRPGRHRPPGGTG